LGILLLKYEKKLEHLSFIPLDLMTSRTVDYKMSSYVSDV